MERKLRLTRRLILAGLMLVLTVLVPIEYI